MEDFLWNTNSTRPTFECQLFAVIAFRICCDFHLFHTSSPAEGLHTLQDGGINKHSGARSALGFALASAVDGRQLRQQYAKTKKVRALPLILSTAPISACMPGREPAFQTDINRACFSPSGFASDWTSSVADVWVKL